MNTLLILILLSSSPLLTSSSDAPATLFVPREEAVYAFKSDEVLEPEDRITVSTEWFGRINTSSQINVTFYRGCDIPLLIQVLPSARMINLWWRRNGKMKRAHTIQSIRENEVTNKLLLYFRFLGGYMNIVVNKVDDLADYQYRADIPMEDLTRITVHGAVATGTTIEVDHRDPKMKESARSNVKRRGPNF